MKKSPTKVLDSKIEAFDEIQKTMNEIWNSLSPSLKKKMKVCEQFQKIQTQAQLLKIKMSGGLINENDQRKT